MTSPDQPETEDTADYPLLDRPHDGLPPVLRTERELAAAAEKITRGHGPVALDSERASGYRYSQRAYLIQLRREGAGSFLVDPISLPDLTPLQEAIGDAEWVLHAATQDLPCLGEVGLHPHRLFDTELGSRLAGLPRVGLATVVEHYLGVTLAKEHSAVDWSTRPLPEPWLVYAALDVEVLVQVRDRLADDLAEQGKLDLAHEEFDALVDFTPAVREGEPWRRTSGIHKVRTARGLALARELWTARDRIAAERDIAPGRILPDAMIVAMATTAPRTPSAIAAVQRKAKRRHGGLARYQRQWLQAIERASALPASALPKAAPRHVGPPPARAWADRDPVAAARLSQVRSALDDISQKRHIPVENLVTPRVLREALWRLPAGADEGVVAGRLRDHGARHWQVELTVPLIEDAMENAIPEGEPGAASS